MVIERPTIAEVKSRKNLTYPTVEEVVDGLENWQKVHNPFDRSSRLNLFQFLFESSVNTESPVAPDKSLVPVYSPALKPLSNDLDENRSARLPAIQLRPNALSQYLARLQVPEKFYARIPNQLRMLNLNWLAQNGNYEREVMLRIQDENQARALMSDLYTPIDTLDLLRTAAPYLKGGRVRWHYDDELIFNMSISFPNYAEEIKVGDVIERGIHIRNSEVGLSSVTIAGYLWQLRCWNGNISSGGGGESFRFRHVGDPERLKEKVVAAIESSKLEVERVLGQFKNALTVKINEPFKLFEQLTKDKDLSQEQFKAMRIILSKLKSHSP